MVMAADRRGMLRELLLLLVLVLVALLPECRSQDVKVYRAGGSGTDPVATVVQESAAAGGFDTAIYPHCVFVDNTQFGLIDTSDDNTLSADELSNDGTLLSHSDSTCANTPPGWLRTPKPRHHMRAVG